MAAHGIDIFDIEFWNGQAPGFAQADIESHTRPGTVGTYQINRGVKGKPFEVQVRHILPTYVDANAMLRALYLLPGTGPVQVKYNFINYLGIYSHLYTVDQVMEGTAKALGGAIGPTYFYPFGGEVSARLVLTPHLII